MFQAAAVDGAPRRLQVSHHVTPISDPGAIQGILLSSLQDEDRDRSDAKDSISIVEAAQILGLNRDTVRELVRKGDLRGYKKTIARTSPFVIEKESVLDYDRRRREQFQPKPAQ